MKNVSSSIPYRISELGEDNHASVALAAFVTRCRHCSIRARHNAAFVVIDGVILCDLHAAAARPMDRQRESCREWGLLVLRRASWKTLGRYLADVRFGLNQARDTSASEAVLAGT